MKKKFIRPVAKAYDLGLTNQIMAGSDNSSNGLSSNVASNGGGTSDKNITSADAKKHNFIKDDWYDAK